MRRLPPTPSVRPDARWPLAGRSGALVYHLVASISSLCRSDLFRTGVGVPADREGRTAEEALAVASASSLDHRRTAAAAGRGRCSELTLSRCHAAILLGRGGRGRSRPQGSVGPRRSGWPVTGTNTRSRWSRMVRCCGLGNCRVSASSARRSPFGEQRRTSPAHRGGNNSGHSTPVKHRTGRTGTSWKPPASRAARTASR
jgi:hypothetical protein